MVADSRVVRPSSAAPGGARTPEMNSCRRVCDHDGEQFRRRSSGGSGLRFVHRIAASQAARQEGMMAKGNNSQRKETKKPKKDKK